MDQEDRDEQVWLPSTPKRKKHRICKRLPTNDIFEREAIEKIFPQWGRSSIRFRESVSAIHRNVVTRQLICSTSNRWSTAPGSYETDQVANHRFLLIGAIRRSCCGREFLWRTSARRYRSLLTYGPGILRER